MDDFAKIKTDKTAREEFILANIGLVYKEVRKATKYCQHMKSDDLVQEGVIGMMKAIDAYDSALGYAFSTYATPKIHQAIQRAIDNQDRTIRLPVNIEEKLDRYRAGTLETTYTERIAYDEYEKPIISLDLTISDGDGRPMRVADVIPDKKRANVFSNKQKLHYILNTLTFNEKKVICYKFGVDGYPQLAEDDIANTMGLSIVSVRKYYADAMATLKKPNRSIYLQRLLP